MVKQKVFIPFKACKRRTPQQWACTPRGFEWIPGYLDQHGGEMTDTGRNWLLEKWEEPYRAALESEEQAYQACLNPTPADGKPPRGLQLRLLSKLDVVSSNRTGTTASGLSTQLGVPFTSTASVPPPCDPFDPDFDTDHPPYPVDPNAPPVSVPRSIFWIGTTATYDQDALNQAMQPVNGTLNPDNPLSLRDLQLSVEGVKGAVRITGHRFLPTPTGVQVYDDVQTELDVASIRLELSAEWAGNGSVLDTWQALMSQNPSGSDQPGAYTNFDCYYFGGCNQWASPPPLFNWDFVASGCLDEVILRAQPSPVTQVRVLGEIGLLATLTLSINHIGSIASRPLVARHRLLKNSGTSIPLPPIFVPPVGIGEGVEVLIAVPACLAGFASLAAEQYPGDTQFSVVILQHAEGWVKLTLTRLASLHTYQAAVEVRFDLQTKADVLFNPLAAGITLVASTLVTWSGCGELSAPHFTLPPIQLGPTPLGGMEHIELSLPSCLVGKMAIAPLTLQSIPASMARLVSINSPNTLALARTWPGQQISDSIDLRCVPIALVGSADASTPHVMVRVPVEWASCGEVAAPHFTLPGIDFGNPALGEMHEFVIPLPDCVVGKMQIAPANLQRIPDTPVVYWNGNAASVSNSGIGLQVLAGDSQETVKVRLTANMMVAVWDFDLAIRLIADGVSTPTLITPHILVKVPVSGFARPDWQEVGGSVTAKVQWGVTPIPGSNTFKSHWTTVTLTAVASHPEFNAWMSFIHLRVGDAERSVIGLDSIQLSHYETIPINSAPSGPHPSFSYQKPASPAAKIELSPKNTVWNAVRRQTNGTYLGLAQPVIPFPFQSYS